MRCADFEDVLLGSLVGDSLAVGLGSISAKEYSNLKRLAKNVTKKVHVNLPVYALAGELYCNGLSGIDFKSVAKESAMGAASGSTGGPIGAAVGAVVGALKAILGKKKDRDGEAWRTYQKGAGQVPGSAYDGESLELALNGAREWYDRRGWNAFFTPSDAMAQKYGVGSTFNGYELWWAYMIAEAIKNGTLPLPTDAKTAAERVIIPQLVGFDPTFSADMSNDPPVRQIVIDVADRILSDLAVGATNRNTRQVHDTLSNVLKKIGWTPPQANSAAPQANVQPVPAPITTQNVQAAQNAASSAVANQALPISASAPSGVTSSITPAQATSAIVANEISQQVSASQPVTDKTLEAIQALAAQVAQTGMQNAVSPVFQPMPPTIVTVPSEKQTVAAPMIATAGVSDDMKKYLPFAAIGLAALFLMRRKK